MFQELKFQLSTAILTILSLAAIIAAGINFDQQRKFRLPDDGVTWVDRQGSVQALHVSYGSQAARAGVRAGDAILKINGVPVTSASKVTQLLVGIGSWNKAEYEVRRRGVEFKTSLIVGEVPKDPAISYLYLTGLAYLVIGLFVYFRRGSAHKARHFYIFWFISFIFFDFHYTGKLNTFDQIIYFANEAAGLLAPTVFLHFCLSFPEPRRWMRHLGSAPLLYAPAAAFLLVFIGITSGAIHTTLPLIGVRWFLDRLWLPLSTVLYLAGGVVLMLERRRAEDPIARQQLKWLRNGAFCAIVPFAVFYVAPFSLGLVPNAYMKMAVLSLVLLPLTLAYAIVRYRLMDVDIIFRRGYAYTLATLCVLATFYAIVFSLGSLVQKNFRDVGNTGLIIVMLMATFLFQPIRDWIQERLDKHFYQDRYDYRRTLVEFARELSSETDMMATLASVADRLISTLSVRHVAFFLTEECGAEPAHYRLVMTKGRAQEPPAELDLSFLNWNLPQPYLFFERTRHQLDAVSRGWPASVRRTIAELDLTYYLPCTVRGRTIAYMGVSRTADGDYLSSVDVELLVTLCGYVGIAIENAGLYRSLQRKVEENERLKEFSENIVESINVGILAVDLEDRVESWNTQIEQLSGISRDRALGRTLAELFPDELAGQFERVRGETGIHHIYKFALRPGTAAVHSNGNGNGNGHHKRFREAILNIAIAPLVSKHQEQIGRLIIFDDVTDRAELEQRLVQADKLTSIGLLAAGVAHEVNTPLAVISTYAQMLAKQVANDEQKTLLLDKIARQTFRASEIVNSLLNFSRTSTTEISELSINRVIQETLSLIDHQLKKAGIRVKTRLEASIGVRGSSGKLQQVFLNLFLNARDAMEPGGILEIETSSDESGIHIDVMDTGHGIAPENLHRIFDPFFTTKGAKKGTGLGLSVSYGIMQEHNGAIEVFQRAGGGTRFRLEFPGVRKTVNA
jgi:two-component system, NtrC family, sensor kinase